MNFINIECWGCGPDWQDHWLTEDLSTHIIYGQNEFVCPDCYEELPEDYEV